MVNIIECDFANPLHRKALVKLMNHYMEDAMGQHPTMNKEEGEKMVCGLEKHPSKLILLAEYHGEYIGLANSFINFGTFAVKPFVNIHDIVVLDKYRGIGAGKKLMEAIIEYAQKNDCGKVTLEVREDNTVAQKMYKSLGFDECKPVMHFWAKYL